MVSNSEDLGTTVTRLHALASKLEGEGQYNVAKLMRASAASLVRTLAYAIELPSAKKKLSVEVSRIAEDLSQFKLDGDLVESIRMGAAMMGEGRLPMLDVTPHPYVCRVCGQVEMKYPEVNCPVCNASPRTFQRYLPVYWLEAMNPFEALTWLRRTPDEVMRLVHGLGEKEMSLEVFEGEWSIRNVLSHLRDAQGVLDFRVHLLINEDNPVIESKAVFEWAKDEVERPPTAEEVFNTYLTSREKTVESLERISLLDWWREGRHEEFGVVSIKQQVSYFATHELTHLPQIQKLKEQMAQA